MIKVLRYSLMLLVFFVSNALYATDITLHEGDNKINVTDWVLNATYTVKQEGKVVIETAGALEVKCNDKTYEHVYAPGSQHGAFHYEVDAKAGDIITITSTFFLNNGSSIWITENGKGPVPITIQQISPAANNTFSWSRAGQMTINFNKQVVYDNIYLVAGGKKYEVDQATVGSNIGCNLTNAIRNAMEEGKMKEGDAFVVRFEGLCEMLDSKNIYNNDGILEVKYFAPSLQGRMVSASVNGLPIKTNVINNYTVLSYYDTESEDGVFTFEFDKNVKKVEFVKLTMGELDRSSEGLYYEGLLPAKIDGKVVTIDLRGELRSYARLFSGIDLDALEVKDTQPFTTISLSLINVVDENGSPMSTDAQGSVGSYSFTFNYQEIVDNIVMDGDRDIDVDGKEKRVGDYIQLWIDQQVKSIEGLNIYFKVIDEGQGVDTEGNPVYVEGVAQVPSSAIDIISSDPNDGTILGFAIPELKTQIEVGGEYLTPADGQKLRLVLKVKTTNGMPHDLVIEYVYRDNATGITTIEKQNNKKKYIYNLAGQRVSRTSARGIYVIDGKTVLK